MRTLQVLGSVSPARGGPTAAILTMLRALRACGIDADVVTTDDDTDSTRLDVEHGRFLPLAGQRVRYFPRQSVKYAGSWPMLGWLRRHVREYDLVHTHGLFSFAPLAAAWCARRAGVPYVMRPAGVLDTWGMRNKSRVVKATSVRLLEGPLLEQAAAVHFMTPLERERAAALGLEIRPVVLPLGFELEPPLPAATLDAGRGGDTRPVILYLARIHPIKCVDRLLEAYAALPRPRPARLVIAGDGATELVHALKAHAARLDLGADVDWLGFTSGEAKQRALGGAQLFVLPSASENFGIAVVEAMHAGLPVIVTEGCGLASFVAKHEAGLVTDGSVGQLAQALVCLLGDPVLRGRLGNSGRAAVARELSLEACALRLEGLYRAVRAGEHVEPIQEQQGCGA